MAKITQYASATRFDANDVLLKDGTNGTKIITAKNAAIEFAGLVSITNRKNTVRGKDLGTSITSAQRQAIANATFDDMFIGDYWTINNRRYYIADMDYWRGTGSYGEGADVNVLTTHHLVLIPSVSLCTGSMNSTDTTEGGYKGSTMYNSGLFGAVGTIRSDFGDMILPIKEYLINEVTDGEPSAAVWTVCDAVLMNEVMLYGHQALASGGVSPASFTIDRKQLALFRMNANVVIQYRGIWLRDVAGVRSFCAYSAYGYPTFANASSTKGVLPVFAICGE